MMNCIIDQLLLLVHSNSSSHDNNTSFSCPFINCFSSDAVIMDGNGRGNMTSHDIRSHSPLLAEVHVIQAINSSNDGLVYYIKLSGEEQGEVHHTLCIMANVITC